MPSQCPTRGRALCSEQPAVPCSLAQLLSGSVVRRGIGARAAEAAEAEPGSSSAPWSQGPPFPAANKGKGGTGPVTQGQM